jgi:hypothetical protein
VIKKVPKVQFGIIPRILVQYVNFFAIAVVAAYLASVLSVCITSVMG